MPSLLLRVLGTLSFLGTAAMLAAVVVGTAYALLLAAGPMITPPRTLAPGAELSFCGFDCHLHVSAASARRDGGLDVTLRFRSDAKRAPEFPGDLRVRVIDASGREFAPRERLPRSELPAGAIATHTLRRLQTRHTPAVAVAAEHAHRQLIVDDIKRFLEQGRDLMPPAGTPTAPPGAPIGDYDLDYMLGLDLCAWRGR